MCFFALENEGESSEAGEKAQNFVILSLFSA